MWPISEIRRELKLADLELQTSEKWSSKVSDHRSRLRIELADWIRQSNQKISESDLVNLPNLEKIPQFAGGSASISHCPNAGGWALTFIEGTQIGFDLENPDTVAREVVLRMSSVAELDLAPSPAHVWAAKEATFKSLLGPQQPLVLSEICLLNWRIAASNLWVFSSQIQSLTSSAPEGIVAIKDDLILGIARFQA